MGQILRGEVFIVDDRLAHFIHESSSRGAIGCEKTSDFGNSGRRCAEAQRGLNFQNREVFSQDVAPQQNTHELSGLDPLQKLRKALFAKSFDIQIVEKCQELLSSQKRFLDGGFHERLFLISLDLQSEAPLEAFERLKANHPEARFAFLANHFEGEEIEHYFSEGIDAFFTTPVHIQKFLNWATDATTMAIDIHESSHLSESDS